MTSYWVSFQYKHRGEVPDTGPDGTPNPPSPGPDGPIGPDPLGPTLVGTGVTGQILIAPDDSGTGFTIIEMQFTSTDVRTFKRWYVEFDTGLGYDVVTASSTWTSTAPTSGQGPYLSLPHSKLAVIGYPDSVVRSYDLDTLSSTQWSLPTYGAYDNYMTGLWGVRNGNQCRIVARNYGNAWDAFWSESYITHQHVHVYDMTGGTPTVSPLITADVTNLAGSYSDGHRTVPKEFSPTNAALLPGNVPDRYLQPEREGRA